jgi:hypothetical protein
MAGARLCGPSAHIRLEAQVAFPEVASLPVAALWPCRKFSVRRGVQVLRRLQVERIDRHHLDRRTATRLCGHEHHRRGPAVDREGQSVDQFLVHDGLVRAGRQRSIDAL